MTLLQGIILGLVQGAGEFLPISSSGHLAVAQRLLGLDDVPLLFDVTLHLSTLVVVVLFFRKKIWALLRAFGRLCARRPAPSVAEGLGGEQDALVRERNLRAYILAIVLSTLVTGVLGIVTEKFIGDMPLVFVFTGFLITAALLVLTGIAERLRLRRKPSSCGGNGVPGEGESGFEKAPGVVQALIIGAAQGAGTLPGISRSGATIAGSILCGVERRTAGEYSFIVSIPAILGAFILELRHVEQLKVSVGLIPLAAGCVAAFVSGYLALWFLMRLVRKGKLQWFACYLIPLGILGIIFLR